MRLLRLITICAAAGIALNGCQKDDATNPTEACQTLEVSSLATHTIIEQTATWCPACGAAKDDVAQAANLNQQVHHMAVHPYGTSDPIGNARTEAFRNSVIKTGSTPYIIGSINANYINQQLQQSPSSQVALSVQKNGSLLTVKAQVRLFEDFVGYQDNGCGVAGPNGNVPYALETALYLGIFLIEDGIQENQVNYGPYTHYNVMRDYLTDDAKGIELVGYGETAEAGRTFCHVLNYDLDANSYHTDLQNCQILAVLFEGNICAATGDELFPFTKGSHLVDIGSL